MLRLYILTLISWDSSLTVTLKFKKHMYRHVGCRTSSHRLPRHSLSFIDQHDHFGPHNASVSCLPLAEALCENCSHFVHEIWLAITTATAGRGKSTQLSR